MVQISQILGAKAPLILAHVKKKKYNEKVLELNADQLAFFNITQPYQFRFKRDIGQRWSNNLIQLNYQQT